MIVSIKVQSSKVHSLRLKKGILPKVSIPRRMRSSSDSLTMEYILSFPAPHSKISLNSS